MATSVDKERISWPQHPEVIPRIIDQLRGEHSGRIAFDTAMLRLRFQRPILDGSYRFSSADLLEQLGFNITRCVIDAARSRICRPLRPVVMPVGADGELERNCKTLTRAVDGIMDSSRFWTFHGPQVFADACTVTLGEIEWDIDEVTGKLTCERADPLSSFWHYDEGREPVNLYADYMASRVVMAAKFPRFKDQIMNLPSWNVPTIVGVEPIGARGTDTIRICKAWRRKIGNQPGHFAVTSGDGKIIFREGKWDHDFFPRVPCRWDQDFRGYGGYPGAAVLAPYQVWTNQIMDAIYKSSKGAVPTVSYHEDDAPQFVSNVPFHRMAWSGNHEPKIVTNNPISNQLFQLRALVKEEAFAEFGMNQAAAEGSMPAGLNSAPAQRERMAIVDSRLYNMQASWEQLCVDSARVIVGLGADYHARNRGKKMQVRSQNDDAFEEIEWPLNLDANKYHMKFSKMSGLSETAWGKKQELAEMRDRGTIDEIDYQRRIDLPDIKAVTDLNTGSADWAQDMVDSALHDAVFVMPSAMLGQNGLKYAIDLGTKTYCRASVQKKWPARNMECLRRWVQACRDLLKGATSTSPVMPVPAVLPGQPAAVTPMPSSVLPPMPALPVPGAAPTVEPAPPVQP